MVVILDGSGKETHVIERLLVLAGGGNLKETARLC
jgi:hypothetical protein